MQQTGTKALHYETLVSAVKGSEATASQAFAAANAAFDVTEPLLLHINEYATFLGVDASLVSEAYYRCRPLFEEMDDSMVVLDPESPFWPKQIDNFAYVPQFLYAQGNVSLLKEPSVSVIGTRSPSLEGRQLAQRTSLELGQAGFAVASGLALGIDGVAHKAALGLGYPTIAVIGTPLGSYYPGEHEELQKQISRQGLVVSRFSPAAKTQKWHFLLRNRLMSALSLASVVVEDRDGGGAVRQASFALEQKRYLFIYQESVDNQSVLWPRQFAGKSRVFVIKKPQDLPRLLNQALKNKDGVGKPKQKAVQLDLFGSGSP
ncbi:MAG: DNA-processing protein DprA [Sphaerochaeta sp.]|jgi:DNA processing protein|uniref:DNA-processing protein DprA n=1 Tax=Sphaerochaeta sp. TaxID=1972642 RepID=UPI002FCA41AB